MCTLLIQNQTTKKQKNKTTKPPQARRCEMQKCVTDSHTTTTTIGQKNKETTKKGTTQNRQNHSCEKIRPNVTILKMTNDVSFLICITLNKNKNSR